MSTVIECELFTERVARLITILNEAAILADTILKQMDETCVYGPHPSGKRDDHHMPCVDHASFSIVWANKTCYLGNTLPFRLFDRLACRPNQFFSYSQLFQDVWDGERSNGAVRTVVKVLKKKLIEAGMSELAAAINGTNSGYYGFTLS